MFNYLSAGVINSGTETVAKLLPTKINDITRPFALVKYNTKDVLPFVSSGNAGSWASSALVLATPFLAQGGHGQLAKITGIIGGFAKIISIAMTAVAQDGIQNTFKYYGEIKNQNISSAAHSAISGHEKLAANVRGFGVTSLITDWIGTGIGTLTAYLRARHINNSPA